MAEEDQGREQVDETTSAPDEQETDPTSDDAASPGGQHPDDETNIDPDHHRDRYVELVNAGVIGTVTLHGRERDIALALDGAAAMRLLKIYQQRSDGTLADRLDARTSSALNGWVVADLDEFIAVTWWPGLPGKPPRTAIDPVVDAA